MSLQDVIGHADLSMFPQVAMVLFLAAFFAVALRTFLRGDELAGAAEIPLDEPVRTGDKELSA